LHVHDAGQIVLGCPVVPIRVTTDYGVLELPSDNFQLFTRGGGAFGAFWVVAAFHSRTVVGKGDKLVSYLPLP
jgi:hypothetical protein